jgi:glucosylceramidase
VGIVALLLSFYPVDPGAQEAGRLPHEIWLTTGAQPGPRLQPLGPIVWSSAGPIGPVITVDTRVKYQVMSGFGAALNDASAFQIGRLAAADQHALLTDLFSRSSGIGLSYLRLTLGSSDFTWQRHYTYDDSCCDLHDFSVAKAMTYTIPVAQAAKALNPELRFMGSPWSAPAWMKENGTLTCASAACKVIGGDYALYAD